MRIIFASLLRLYQNVTKQNYFITEYHIKRKNGHKLPQFPVKIGQT